MVNDDIKRMLKSTETELLEFIKFIKYVEEQEKNVVPDAKTGYKSHPSERAGTSRKSSSEDGMENNALFDAFGIVNGVLTRLSKLIVEFSSALTTSGRRPYNESHVLNYYYRQYVYQMVLYLTKIIEENLATFSSKLVRPTSPERKSESFKSRMPMSFKFNHFIPATLFKQDDSMYESPQPRDYKSRLKSGCQNDDSNSSSSSAQDIPDHSDEEITRKVSKSREREVNDSVHEVFHQLSDVLKLLVSTLQEVLQQLKDVIRTQHPQTQQFGMFPEGAARKRSSRDKALKCLCSEECSLCCSTCKGLNRKRKHTVPDISCRSWYEDVLPLLDKEPYWMQTNPAKMTCYNRETSAYISGKGSKNYDYKNVGTNSSLRNQLKPIQSLDNHATQVPSSIRDAPLSDGESGTKGLASKAKTPKEKILAESADDTYSGIQRRRLSSGTLKPRAGKPRISPNERQRTIDKLKKMASPKALVNRMKKDFLSAQKDESIDTEAKNLLKTADMKQRLNDSEVSSERKSESVTADDNKQQSLKRRKSSVTWNRRCSLNELYENGQNAGNIQKLIKRSLNDCCAYPHKVEFDINQFTNNLEKEFRCRVSKQSESPDKSEGSTILDILIECFRESTVFCYGSEEKIEKDESDDKISKETETKDDSEEGFYYGAENFLETFVTGVIRIVSEMFNKDSLPQLTPEEENALRQVKEIDVFTATSNGSETKLGILVPRLDSTKRRVEQACELCKDVLGRDQADSEGKDKNLELIEVKRLKGSCFRCWNAYHQGITIHQCHDSLPSDIFEMRHTDDSGKVTVCFRKWDQSKECDDWRWLKNPFYDPTRIEMEQEASFETGPVFKVIYGPEGTMVKESFAETRLKTVGNFSQMAEILTGQSNLRSDERGKTHPRISFEVRRTISKPIIDRVTKKTRVQKSPLLQAERNVLRKLGRFFDDIQKVGYGKGPPLVVKVRRPSALNDAYNILMAPSRISLNYYRSLRAVFICTNESTHTASFSNFIKEDQTEELFELITRKLFSSDMHLFEYPSEETVCLYFNPKTQTHHQWFGFAGAILALAILHQKKIDIKLALCLFKCLLDRPLNIHDLQEIDPLLYQNLMWIKNNDLSSRKGIKRTFVIRDKAGYHTFEKELIPNGGNIEVTEKNKYRYIELAVKWKLAESCLTPLREFRSGFSKVIDPCFLTFFSEMELQSMVRKPPDTEPFLRNSFSEKSSGTITRRETL